MKEILQNNKLYIIGFFIAFEILNIYNFINLKMPPQVFELFTFDENFYNHLIWHSIRLILCLPHILLSLITNLTYNESFSYYSFIILICILWEINNILSLLITKSSNIFRKLFSILFLLILVTNMNGRLLIPYLGYLILINEFFCYQTSKSIHSNYIIIGLILTMMSTGTFGVGLIYVVLMLFFSNKLRTFILGLSSTEKVIVICIFIYFFIMLKKIIDYYTSEGDLLYVLTHGLGYFMYGNNLVNILLIVFCILFLNYFIITRYLYDKKLPLILAVLIPCWCSVFGYSAATMLICPLFILITLYILVLKERIIQCH